METVLKWTGEGWGGAREGLGRDGEGLLKLPSCILESAPGVLQSPMAGASFRGSPGLFRAEQLQVTALDSPDLGYGLGSASVSTLHREVVKQLTLSSLTGVNPKVTHSFSSGIWLCGPAESTAVLLSPSSIPGASCTDCVLEC